MLFKKVNIKDELKVLEYSQEILNDRMKNNQIDPQTYLDKSLKIREKIEDYNKKEQGKDISKKP